MFGNSSIQSLFLLPDILFLYIFSLFPRPLVNYRQFEKVKSLMIPLSMIEIELQKLLDKYPTFDPNSFWRSSTQKNSSKLLWFQDIASGSLEEMGSEGGAIEKQTSAAAAGNPATSSCRRKKSENATFVEDVRDHIDEFINASMDEHKTCFQKTIRKMFGMSKVVAERNAEVKEVESSLPLRTVVSK
nr:Protein phosphatase 1 regulatory subunit 3A like [Ipomoea batatas]